MSAPQAAIFQESSNQFYHLEYSVVSEVSSEQLKAALLIALREKLNGVNIVVGFGKAIWDKLNSDVTPEGFISFESLNKDGKYPLLSTQQDLFFWVHSQNQDDNFDQILHINKALSGVAELTLDLPGFTYHDSRDLIGFVDGTANPKEDKRQKEALIPDGKPGAGGSFVLSQKWVHDLSAFNDLPVAIQEKVVGRTKIDDVELEGDAMPDDSHVSRTDVKFNGTAAKIYRRSAPYGNALEHGLYFLAFSCDVNRFDVQLKHMFGLAGDGLHDKLIEYSKPVTSSYWFAPSATDLNSILSP
ncbi:MAG: Dyp-type peroxidase [Agarilytica sp.]